MTCAKRQVRAILTVLDGRRFVGRNDCANPHSSCPRQPGEDYSLCRFACRQYGHAEVMALRAAREAGADTRGAALVVQGHDRMCEACRAAMVEAGVNSVKFERLAKAFKHPGKVGFDVLPFSRNRRRRPGAAACRWVSAQRQVDINLLKPNKLQKCQ